MAPFARSRLKNNEMYEALNQFFEQDSEEFSWRSLKLVLLLRASPMFPFTVINYSCGVSKLGFSTYAVGTAAGMVPWLVIDVWAGTLLTDLTEVGEPQGLKYVALIGVFTVLITIFITLRAKRFLARYRRAHKRRGSDSGSKIVTEFNDFNDFNVSDDDSLRASGAPLLLDTSPSRVSLTARSVHEYL